VAFSVTFSVTGGFIVTVLAFFVTIFITGAGVFIVTGVCLTGSMALAAILAWICFFSSAIADWHCSRLCQTINPKSLLLVSF
jgi:hypothetical protein